MPVPVGSAQSQTIIERQFSPFPNTVVAMDSRCNFDLIDGKDRDLTEFTFVQDNVQKTVIGWGVFSEKEGNVGQRILLAVTAKNGERWATATRREARSDVANYLKNKKLINSGFSASAAFDNLESGEYMLNIIIENDGQYSLCGIEKKISILKKA